MKPLLLAIAAVLVVAGAQAQIGPPGGLWRGSSGPGSYNTIGPGGYATGGTGGALPAPPAGGCQGVIDLGAGCALPMLGGAP